MTRVTLEAAGNDTLQEFLELTFIQWLWVQVRAESHTLVQTPTLWFQSFQGVNCLWRISIIYTFQENYISRNMCIRVTKLGSTMQSHAALNMDAKCSEPSSALTLSPTSSEGALPVSQEIWLRGGIFCVPDSAGPVGHTALPQVWCVGWDSISPKSAGTKNFLPGLTSWIHANTGLFRSWGARSRTFCLVLV